MPNKTEGLKWTSSKKFCNWPWGNDRGIVNVFSAAVPRLSPPPTLSAVCASGARWRQTWCTAPGSSRNPSSCLSAETSWRATQCSSLNQTNRPGTTDLKQKQCLPNEFRDSYWEKISKVGTSEARETILGPFGKMKRISKQKVAQNREEPKEDPLDVLYICYITIHINWQSEQTNRKIEPFSDMSKKHVNPL